MKPLFAIKFASERLEPPPPTKKRGPGVAFQRALDALHARALIENAAYKKPTKRKKKERG